MSNKPIIGLLAIIIAIVLMAGCISPDSTNKNNQTEVTENGAAEKPVNLNELASKESTQSALGEWKISIKAKGTWTATVNESFEDIYSRYGKGNEIFLSKGGGDISIKAITDTPSDFINIELTRSNNDSSEIYKDSGIGAVAVSNTDNSYSWKPIQLEIDSKSDFRSDIPLLSYKSSKDLLYNTVISDLLSVGYRIIPQSESQAKAPNKLSLKYKEETTDDEWGLPGDMTAPRIKGTYIKCEVRLKNSATNADIKKIIYASTKYNVRLSGSDYGSVARDIYFSAFSDFHEQLSELINSELVIN